METTGEACKQKSCPYERVTQGKHQIYSTRNHMFKWCNNTLNHSPPNQRTTDMPSSPPGSMNAPAMVPLELLPLGVGYLHCVHHSRLQRSLPSVSYFSVQSPAISVHFIFQRNEQTKKPSYAQPLASSRPIYADLI